MKRITSLLVGIAAIAISAVSAFAQAPDGPVIVAATPIDAQLVSMGDVVTLLGVLVKTHPWEVFSLLLSTLVGANRIVVKPFVAWLHTRVEENPTPREKAWLDKFDNSSGWWIFLQFADWLGSVKPTTFARFMPGSGKSLQILLIAAIPCFGLVGCVGSSPERIALNANSVAEDSIDAALKAWSISVAARERSADAMQATAPAEAAKRLVAINDEKLKVAAAKEAFALAEQAAIKGWLSAKQTTNAPVSTLSNSLEAAKEPFLTLLRQLSQ